MTDRAQARSIAAGFVTFFVGCLFFKGTQEGSAVWLDPKVTKRSSQQKGFFAARAFALQTGKTTDGKQLPLTAFRSKAGPSANISYCPSRRSGHHVLPVSAEAGLLTVLENTKIIYMKDKTSGLVRYLSLQKGKGGMGQRVKD